MDTVLMMVQLEKDDRPGHHITDDDMADLQGMMFELCDKLQSYGFVRCEIYENNVVWNDRRTAKDAFSSKHNTR